jgi:pimeloyl-ACP methyl ester carboxylesterase
MPTFSTVRVRAQDGTDLAAFDSGPVAGSADRPVIALVNGLGGNIEAWRYFTDFFAPRFRVVSWDYRGLYASGPAAANDYAVSTHADDLQAVLDHFGVQNAVLVGWSMGVQVSIEQVRRRPQSVAGLVLINGTYGKPLSTAFGKVLGKSPIRPMIPAILKAVESVAHLAKPAQPMAQKVVQTRAALMTLRGLGLVSATLDEAMFTKLATEVALLDMPRYMAILNALGDHCAEAVLPSIAVPTLVISGDRDLFTPVEQSREIARRVTDAELLVIPGGTHYTPLEFPELIHLRVQKFLHERFGVSDKV